MLTIYKKEINAFLSSLIGYIAIGVFLVLMSAFTFIFPGFSILDFGYATLAPLFEMAPIVFLILIPAVTMRSFAEEKGTGTIELLVTKPVSDLSIIMGKYFASLTLVLFSLLPTLLYFWTIGQLGEPQWNIDTGGVWGSYIGLFFLAASFVAIGIFSSSLTKNQITAFILAVVLCFMMYWFFDAIAGLGIFFAGLDNVILSIGILSHYESISKGILDTRDVLYFLSVIAIFITLTKLSLESRKW